MMWGSRKENGIWRCGTTSYRMIWRGHDALFVAVGKTRLRLMKPRRMRRSW